MDRLRRCFPLLFTMVVLALSACAQHAVAPVVAPAQAPESALAVFTMQWPTPAPGVRPNYISPSTQSLSIQVNNAQGLLVVNNPGTGGTSKVAIDAPVGSDWFTIKTYDLLGAQGTVLSQTQVSQKIIAGKANTVSAVLNGVVASIALSLASPAPIAGAPATSSLTVTAKDADGNVIVGPGGYDQAIHISDSDSVATSLSSTLVTAPGPALTLAYNGNSIFSAMITASAAGVPSSTVTLSPKPHVYEFAVPTASSQPSGIAAGPDGALWFAEASGNKIGRITIGGSISEFALPTASSFPDGIAAGPDGALWFAESGVDKIGRMTTGGSISEFALPTALNFPGAIAAGPDGALWFTENNTNKIGRITTGGSISEFAVPTASSNPSSIAAGPDGALWFTEINTNKIGRITTGGSISEFAVPTASSNPSGIAAGPDGALWFTEGSGDKVGRITTGGSISEFAVPTASSQPYGIAAGPDGALWFTEAIGNQIGRITTNGSISEFAVPTPTLMYNIAAGPDGALWFTEASGNQISRLVY